MACELENAPKGAFKAKQEITTQTDTSSATTRGWVKQDGAWYCFDGNGNSVKNAWQGSYYLKADGKMAQSEWIYDDSYQAWYYLNQMVLMLIVHGKEITIEIRWQNGYQ